MNSKIRAALLALATLCTLPGAYARSDAEVLKVLEDIVAKNNLSLPADQGDGVRMERMSAGPGKLLTYHVTTTNARLSQVTGAMKAELDRGIRADVCASKQMAVFRRNGVTVAYAYSSSDGHPYATVRIEPDSCPN